MRHRGQAGLRCRESIVGRFRSGRFAAARSEAKCDRRSGRGFDCVYCLPFGDVGGVRIALDDPRAVRVITPGGPGVGIDALRPTTPDVGAVARSLLGVLAMAAVALASASPSAAVWALGRRGDRRRDRDAGQPRRTGAGGHRGVAADGRRRVPRRVDRVLQRGVHRRRRGLVLRGRHAVGAWQQAGPGRGRERCAVGDLAAGCAFADRGGVFNAR